MAFKNKYTSDINYCILPFFGFEKDTDYSFYTQGVYVSDPNARSGQSKVYKSHSYEVSVFCRKSTPTGKELDLENKFIQAVSSKYQKRAFLDGYFNPLQTTSIEKSLKEYYDIYVKTKNRPEPKPLPPIHWIAIALTVIWFAPYSITFPMFEQMFGYDIGSALFVFPVPMLIWLVYAIVKKILTKVYDKAYDKECQKCKNAEIEFSSLTKAQKEEVRQQYFAQMERFYGPEAGAVLKEYAILKGYDRY